MEEGLERFIVMDSGVFTLPKEESFTRHLCSSFCNILKIEHDDVRREMEYLDDIPQSSNVKLIEEVRKEVDRYLELVNNSVRYLGGFYNRNGDLKKPGKIALQSNGLSEERGYEIYKDLLIYTHKFYEVYHPMCRSGDPQGNFFDESKDMYDVSLHIANNVHKRRPSNGSELLCITPENVKFGERLNTDCKLIASSLALSMHNPVVLISNDNPLKEHLTSIRDRINHIGQTRKELGEPHVLSRHPIETCTLQDFLSDQSLS